MTGSGADFRLYPDWDGHGLLPGWVARFGLTRYRPLLSRIRAASDHIRQAELDGIGHVGPVLAGFNASPAQVRAEIGGRDWKAVHHGKISHNVNRLWLRWVAGWTWAEAMEWPTHRNHPASAWAERTTKSALLVAARCARDGDDFIELATLARDVVRMGGDVETDRGRKHLRRQHDALIVRRAIAGTDATPWADPWEFETDGYRFSLLKSALDLAMEGARQRHCVASYAHACRAGAEAVLRIEGRERATCSFNLDRKNRMPIQVKGFANRNVSADCRAAARAARAAYLDHLKRKATT